jgi:hypothetical protein
MFFFKRKSEVVVMFEAVTSLMFAEFMYADPVEMKLVDTEEPNRRLLSVMSVPT